MSNHFTYIEALPVAFHHSDIYCKVTNPYRNSPDLAQVSGHLWFNIPTHFPDSSFTDIAHWATLVALSSTSIICQKSFLHRALLQETACTVLSHSLFHWLALSVPLLFNWLLNILEAYFTYRFIWLSILLNLTVSFKDVEIFSVLEVSSPISVI